MVGMPVATLRTWERRFRVTASVKVRSGHRLYTTADVRRLVLLKRLTQLGHAIGAVASLDITQLRQLSETHAGALAARQVVGPITVAGTPPRRLAVLGPSLAQRLQRPAFMKRHGSDLICVSACDTLGAAQTLLRAGDVDCIVVEAAGLHVELIDELICAAGLLPAGALAVLFAYAPKDLPEMLVAAGIRVQRQAVSDARLVAWLRADATADISVPQWDDLTLPPGLPASRRFDDNALTDLLGLSSTIVCECPKHMAEILLQLLRFEAYSAECAARDRNDASMHVYLQRVAGTARQHFEAALERLAKHEGLLPQS
jgi:DNA-binding transcriptional MerR regulator